MSVSEAQDGVLRRVRSAGDLSRRPERALVHSTIRMSESTSDPYNFDSNEASGLRSSSPTTRIVPPTSSPPLQLDTNTIPSPPTLPTQTTTPGPQPQPPNIPLRVRILTFFGLGRRATRARKSLVSVIWNISWGFLQVSFRFTPFYHSKLRDIVRGNRPYADSDCNPFQESHRSYIERVECM